MEGWHWTPSLQQGLQWTLGGGQAGDGGTQHGSLEGVDSLPEAMAKSRQQASRRVSRSNSKQFERMASQVRCLCIADWLIDCMALQNSCNMQVTMIMQVIFVAIRLCQVVFGHMEPFASALQPHLINTILQ